MSAPGIGFARLVVLIGSIGMIFPTHARACAALRVPEQQPETVISGFNIYAPEVLSSGATHNATLLFGGWLDQQQMPHDAIYRCTLLTNSTGWHACGPAAKVVSPDKIAPSLLHINDPAVECSAAGGECRFAATVCAGQCAARPQLSQIWIGKSSSEARIFTQMIPFLVDGAAEPALGSLPAAPSSPVIYFTRRRAGDLATIFAQPVDWHWLTPDGQPIPVLVDRGDYVITSVDYLHVSGCHILVWNRHLPVRDRAPVRTGELRGIELAYSVASDGGQWSGPRPLPLPAGAPCMALTPALAIDPHGQIALFVGAVTATNEGACVITTWSKHILHYVVQLS